MYKTIISISDDVMMTTMTNNYMLHFNNKYNDQTTANREQN